MSQRLDECPESAGTVIAELVSLVKPEDSNAEHEKLLAIEEEIMQTLALPYQVVLIGSGDLGVQAYRCSV